MYNFKQRSEEEIKASAGKMQILQVMGMNRTARRQFSKANHGIKIPGSTKPVVNTKTKS